MPQSRYFNFNDRRDNDRVKIEVEVPLEALDDSAVVDNLVFTTDSHTVTVLPRLGILEPWQLQARLRYRGYGGQNLCAYLPHS